MRLFFRLFLSHIGAVITGLVVIFALGLVLSERYYQLHVGDVLRAAGAEGLALFDEIEQGHRLALLWSFISALPFAFIFAVAMSYRESRRVARAVQALTKVSQALAMGQYSSRVELVGEGELTDLAEHFNAMAVALGKLERERHELISVVAHELRTPLAALQGYAEALADGVMPIEVATKAIRREASSLRRMTHDLLMIARVEAGVIEVHPEVCATETLLRDAHERFVSAYEGERIALRLELPSQASMVWADPERVLQVFSNLLSNALRHTPAGGSVTIGARSLKSEVVFFVSDTGPGIPGEHQAYVFERFYVVDPSRSRTTGGIGVGLAICKGLVTAMKGRIWLRSRPGYGATFEFALPIRAVALSQEGQPDQSVQQR
jgi:two-component system, OmpR family, sensor histidine kinase BaeS